MPGLDLTLGGGSLSRGELCDLTCTEMGSFWIGGRGSRRFRLEAGRPDSRPMPFAPVSLLIQSVVQHPP